MPDQVTELLDLAVDREIVSQAFYIAGKKMVSDPGARQLLAELADEEGEHIQWVKGLMSVGVGDQDWLSQKVADLRLSDYLIDSTMSSGSTVQDVLTMAIKREAQSVAFYSEMLGAIRNQRAHDLCQKLLGSELNHKMKLEKMYDDEFYAEN